MPELPEIARLRQSLEALLPGAVVTDVRLRRRDIVRSSDGRTRRAAGRVPRRTLLLGQRIATLTRHGKELAIVSAAGPALCVHLGMCDASTFTPTSLCTGPPLAPEPTPLPWPAYQADTRASEVSV